MSNQIPILYFSKITEKKEKIQLIEKPAFLPFVLKGTPLLLIGFIWCIIDMAFLYKIQSFSSENLFKIIVPFITFHLLPFYIGVIDIIRRVLIYRKTFYAITQKRVIIRRGFIKEKFYSIEYENIEKVTLKGFIFDKIYRTGSIIITKRNVDENQSDEIFELESIINYKKSFKMIKRSHIRCSKLEVKQDEIFKTQGNIVGKICG